MIALCRRVRDEATSISGAGRQSRVRYSSSCEAEDVEPLVPVARGEVPLALVLEDLHASGSCRRRTGPAPGEAGGVVAGHVEAGESPDTSRKATGDRGCREGGGGVEPPPP
jgi:hypothetical protein